LVGVADTCDGSLRPAGFSNSGSSIRVRCARPSSEARIDGAFRDFQYLSDLAQFEVFVMAQDEHRPVNLGQLHQRAAHQFALLPSPPFAQRRGGHPAPAPATSPARRSSRTARVKSSIYPLIVSNLPIGCLEFTHCLSRIERLPDSSLWWSVAITAQGVIRARAPLSSP